MQTTPIVSAVPFRLRLREKLSQLKKLWFPAALFISCAFFAAPASGQVTITTNSQGGAFLSNPYTVTFTTAQTGLTASNFSVTGSVTGAYVSSVTGSGTSWTVYVTVPSSFQSAGEITLNMVNSTNLSPGVTGLPVSGPSILVINYPLTATLTFSSTNANHGYAKNGDMINFTFTSTYYTLEQYSVTIAGQSANGSLPSGNIMYGQFTLGSGTAQGAIASFWNYTNQFNEFNSGTGSSTVIFDNTAPSCTINTPSAATVSGNGTNSVAYTVTYADANFASSDLTTSGITLNTTGTATGTLGISGSGTTYTVTISNISGSGTVGISVGAGYATDKAGNTDAGAGPSSTVNVATLVPPSISYISPVGYQLNTAISPLSPVVTAPSVFLNPFPLTPNSTSLALDYQGDFYEISGSNANLIMSPAGGGAQVTAYNQVLTGVASAAISPTLSTLVVGSASQIQAINYTGGVYQSPTTIASVATNYIVAAVAPSSGPNVMVIFGEAGSNQLYFSTGTGGTYSSPATIPNATSSTPIAVNNVPAGVQLAFVGPDGNLYSSIYANGVWSVVAPFSTSSIAIPTATALGLDTQGNVYYCTNTGGQYVLNKVAAGTVNITTVATLQAAGSGIAFDNSGNIYVNNGSGAVLEIPIPGNFSATPALPAGLSVNSFTGAISGTPTAFTPATNYTITGTDNVSATVNIQTVIPPTLSYGAALNAAVGTAITPIVPTSTSVTTQNYSSRPATFASVTGPSGLAVDASGNVYVNQNNSVFKIPAGGGTPTALNSDVAGPIYIDAAGNFYEPYLSPGNAPTFAMFPAGSTATNYEGNPANGSYFNSIQGLAADQAGNVYVGSATVSIGSSTSVVYEYPNRNSQNGFFVPVVIATGFTSLSGVAVDATGDIYVSDAGAGTIDVIPANRGQWTTLASGLGAPANICIDGGGNLYFSDNTANTIREIPAGSTTPVVLASGLGSITALVIGGTGYLYAADNTNSVIDQFSPIGGYYISPILPSGLSFNSVTGVISGTPAIASAAANYTITAYNATGSAPATQNIAATATLPALSYAAPLAFTTGFASIPANPVSTGVAAQGYSTTPFFTDYTFNAPYALAVDTSLNVYIADAYNSNAQNLGYAGTGHYNNYVFSKGVGLWTVFTGTNVQLLSIAADSTGDIYGSIDGFIEAAMFAHSTYTLTVLPSTGEVYSVATDSHGDVFGTHGSSVLEIPSGSTGAVTVASGFNEAAGIAVDGVGNIFTVDRGNNTLYKIPAGSSTPAAVATGFNTTWQLAADGTGNVFIADGGNGVIKELPAGGSAVSTVLTGFKTPNGVAVDVNGALYVADLGFAQVRKYAPTGGYYISPSLPAGLSFNNSTGVISGTPTAVTAVKNYKITAYNLSGSTQTTVTFGVAAPSSTLAGLTVSAGSLSPAFASSTLSYSVSAPYLATQTTVTPVTADPNATVTVNGNATSPGVASAPISLALGANTITIVIRASDGSSTQTYTVTVNRAAASTNAQLATANIGYIYSGTTTQVTVTPTTVDPTATVTVDGVAVASGTASNPITLSSGSNAITVVVTSQAGNKLTYTLTVQGPISNVSTLSSLTISAGTLSVPFSNSTTGYVDNVANAIVSVTVTPTTTDPNATVTVSGTSVTSGTASGSIALAVGNTTIPTIVTAQDGLTTTTYTIVVTRSNPAPVINYSSPQIYGSKAAIAPLSPASSNVAAAGYSSTPIVLGSGLSTPTGVAVDAAGNTYVADYGNKLVKKIPAGNGTPVVLGSGFTSPYGVAVDGSGNVFVADYGASAIYKLAGGAGTPVKIGSGFSTPTGVAVDGSGNVYVADYGNNAVKEIIGGTGTPVALGSGFSHPIGVAVDGAGNVYVGDRGNDAVKKIPAGNGTPVILGSGFTSTFGIAVDASDNVYVGDYTANQVKMIPAGSNTPVAIGSGFSEPDGVAVDGAGNLFVADMGHNAIKQIQPTGGYYIGPFLPAGLAFNNSTGTLSGTPTAISAAAAYKVTAYNGVGVTGTASLNITITPPVPVISYSGPETYFQSTAIAPLTPTSSNVAAAGYSGTPVVLGSGFSGPTSVAADASGNVYVADYGNKLVKKIPAGNGTPVILGTGFTDPYGVAVDAAGDVFVADFGASAVYKLTGGAGTPVKIGSGFSTPAGVAVDGSGNVYVADYGNNAIKELVGGTGTPVVLGSGFSHPIGISVDASGNVYVGDHGNSAVKKIPAGNGTPVALGSGFSTPSGVAVDASGNIYVGDYGNSQVKMIPAGSNTPVVIGSGFSHPDGVAVDGAGNIYVADYTNNAVKQIQPTGGYYIGPFLPAGLAFNNATGVLSGTPAVLSTAVSYKVTAYDGAGISGATSLSITVSPSPPVFSYSSPNVYSQNTVITALAPTSIYVAAAGYSSTPAVLGSGFSGPTGVAVDAAGNTYVADYGNKLVKKIPAGNGTPVVIGSGFTDPYGVAVDAAGDVFVADYGANAVYKIPGGTGTPAKIGSGFSAPAGVAVDGSGNVYVADYGNNAVKEIVGGTGTPVILGSGFAHPIGISVDASGNVYVGDHGNNLIKKIPAGNGTPLVLGSGFSTPSGVAVDASGNIYVGDYGNSLVKMIPAGSNTPVVIGSGFSHPDGVAVDAAGNVYVADYTNNAVKQIQPTGGYYIGPFLPAGLAFNNSTGVISGTPVVSSLAITYNVTAYNKVGAGTASLSIAVLSNNANLSNLVLSSGPLSPVFAAGTTTYTASVASTVSSVTVTPTTSSTAATVKVDGTLVSSGSASPAIGLVTGANTITVAVTAANGLAVQTYTLTVTQSAPAAAFRPVNFVTGANSASTGDGILVHKGVSPNGDGVNDFLLIDGITQYNSHLTIVDRNGALVYQVNGYDNQTIRFDGHSTVNGKMQQPGTYFYVLDYAVNGTMTHKTGYIILKY